MESPKVSVVIGSYNRGEFIQETIYSVINQTFKEWELIIVDDCSTDDSYEKVKEIHDERIRIIRLDKNSGIPAVPRNRGIGISKGEYIAFLDSDDIWLSDKLKFQVECLNQDSDIGLAFCTFKIASRDREYNNKTVAPRRDNVSGYVYDKLINCNFITASSVMIRSSVLNETRYFDESPEIIAAEDWDLWLRIARKYKIAFISKVLGFYRMHSSGLSMNGQRLERALYVISKHFKKGWITKKQADNAKANFYFREGWLSVDKDIKMSRLLLYNALHASKGNLRLYCVTILGLFLSIFPFLCKFIKKKSLGRKIGNRILNPQDL